MGCGNLFYLPVKLEQKDGLSEEARPAALYEWRCEPTSELARWFLEQGQEARRLCLPEYDMSRQEVVMVVVRRMIMDAQRGLKVALWAALPCTSWSTWRYINTAVSERARKNIEEEQQKSLDMIKLLTMAIGVLRARIPENQLVLAFEWPKGAI